MWHNDPRPFDDLISFGRIPSAIPWAQNGYNGDVGATVEDIWAVSTTYNWLAAAAQLEIVGGAGDVAAGAGVQQVQLFYLDAAFGEHSEIITMTGAVPANTVANNIFRIQSFRAYRVGANGVASANIDIRSLGGGAVRDRILSGFTASRSSIWTVPAGKTLYLDSIVFSSGSAAGGKNILMSVKSNYDDINNTLLTPRGVFFMPSVEVLIQDDNFYRELEIPVRYPATTDLKATALSDSAGAICTSIMRGFLVTGTAP